MESKERQVINSFIKFLPGSPYQKNNFFESDAEHLSIDFNQILFSTDAFSSEDLFCDDNPYLLGQNLAICTISDILASGGDPMFFSHCFQVPEKWNKLTIDKFAQGIGSVLMDTKCGFIGGDLGVSDNWNYTGICIGKSQKYINRIGCRAEDNIYLSGKIGLGNLQAAFCLYSDYLLTNLFKRIIEPKFQLRLKESQIIRNYATACIDTSDGLLNGLNTLAELNDLGFLVDSIPYLNQCQVVSKMLSKSIELFFMGECGEYELLFTIPDNVEDAFLSEAKNNGLKFYKIGKISSSPDRIVQDNAKRYCFNEFYISARNYNNLEDYLKDLDQFIKQ